MSSSSSVTAHYELWSQEELDDLMEYLKLFNVLPANLQQSDDIFHCLQAISLRNEGFNETNVKLVELLLEYGADIMDMSNPGRRRRFHCTMLLENCILSNRVKTAEILIRNGADVNAYCRVPLTFNDPDCLGIPSFLCCAAMQCNPFNSNYNRKMVTLLLKNGATVDPSFICPFKLLRKWVDLDTMIVLFNAGVDPVAVRSANKSLLGESFNIAMGLELDTQFSSRTLTVYKLSLEYIRFFLQIGCPEYIPNILFDAMQRNAFLTVSFTYKYCMELQRDISWPSWIKKIDDPFLYYSYMSGFRYDKKPLTSLDQWNAKILKAMIQRTQHFCGNGDNVLKYLNSVIEGTLTPTLLQISIRAVRSIIAKNGRKVENVVDELPFLSVPVKRKLCLVDLQEHCENSLVRFFAEPIKNRED